MNSNTKAPTSTGCPSIRPEPTKMASAPPAVRRAARSRSLYFFESRNPSGSTLSMETSAASKLPGSSVSSRRRAAGTGK